MKLEQKHSPQNPEKLDLCGWWRYSGSACCRTLGLAFSKTASSVVSQTLLEHLQNKL